VVVVRSSVKNNFQTAKGTLSLFKNEFRKEEICSVIMEEKKISVNGSKVNNNRIECLGRINFLNKRL
jgi:hypothetical protein